MNRRLLLLSILLLALGILNAISVKNVARVDAYGIHFELKMRRFVHPFIMSLTRFLGDFLCIFVYLAERFIRKRLSTTSVEELLPLRQSFSMLPVALLSACAVIIVTLGYHLAEQPFFNLMRGMTIFFTAILSLIFLNQVLRCNHWIGVLTISLGLLIMGLADLIFRDEKRDTFPLQITNSVIAGVLLMLIGQMITATQVVLEQRYVRMYDMPPLLAVGLEGLFASTIIFLLLFPTYFIRIYLPMTADPENRFENALDALAMIGQSQKLRLGLIGMMITGPAFNYVGMIILKEQSALARQVLSCNQIVTTWMLYLICEWIYPELYRVLIQTIGSILIAIIGPCVYFNVICSSYFNRCTSSSERLLACQQSSREQPSWEQDYGEVTVDEGESEQENSWEYQNENPTISQQEMNERTRLIVN